MQNNVLILLSSYNGEKYIREQLDSIFSQKNVKLHLVIRDDGSSDGTIAIIDGYIHQFPNKITLIKGDNVGWRKSFFFLIQYAAKNFNDYEYFAFCDQDDIWMTDKLNVACEKLKQLNESKPRLYCSNLYYYKDGRNYGKIKPSGLKTTFKNCLILNYATGCSVVFDKNLLKLISSHLPSITVAHDQWMYMVAVLCGKVIIDDNAYILYRQHGGNQVGATKGYLNLWRKRLGEIRRPIDCSSHEILAKELYSLYASKMSSEAQCAVKKMKDYRTSLKNWFLLLIDNEYTTRRFTSNFWLKLRIITCRL